MNGGTKAALLVSCLTIVGCSAGTSMVKVRAIADPSAVLSRGGDEVAVARGQLLLGNVGLALEGFRKAQRANPSDPAAPQGIGDCYAAMSRFDLAQSNYEAALALAPHDRGLLLGLADIFDREGKPALAIAARAEATIVPQAAPAPASRVAPAEVRAVAPPHPAAAPQATRAVQVAASRPVAVTTKTVEQPRPSVGSITVELPAARPVAMEAPAAPSKPQPGPATSEPAEMAAAYALPPAPPVAFAEQPLTAASAPPSIGSITVELPEATPAKHLAAQPPAQPVPQSEPEPVVASAVTVPLPPAPRPLEPQLPREPSPATVEAVAPRLERLSSGEVALVTTDKPLWPSSKKVRTASASSVRWVALNSASDRPNVRILNAARSQGLAASARTVLLNRGWRKIAVGDAPATLHKSVVLYPKSRKTLGRRLAAQFGVSAQMAERDDVVLVLGRDSVDRITPPGRS